jgi:SlyX protein
MDQRIINLEVKFSHQDMLLEELNKIVTSQQMMLEKLQKEITELKHIQSENAPQSPRSLADEVPPHY